MFTFPLLYIIVLYWLSKTRICAPNTIYIFAHYPFDTSIFLFYPFLFLPTWLERGRGERAPPWAADHLHLRLKLQCCIIGSSSHTPCIWTLVMYTLCIRSLSDKRYHGVFLRFSYSGFQILRHKTPSAVNPSTLFLTESPPRTRQGWKGRTLLTLWRRGIVTSI